MSSYIRWPGNSNSSVPTYASAGALPSVALDGAVAVTLDTDSIYVYNLATTTWKLVASSSVILSIGTIDSATASANGAVAQSNQLILQSASGTKPGLVNLTAQTFAGDKTFTGNISALNLSGTNTGDQTITLTGDVTGSGSNAFAATITANAVSNSKLAQMASLRIKGNNTGGASDPIDLTVSQVNTMLGVAGAATSIGALDGQSANATGLALSAQVLYAQSATASFPGLVNTTTQTFAGNKTFNGSISASNLSGTNTGDQTITLTGDVTGTGASSFAATIASNVVSNAKLAQMASATLKGNNTGGTANAIDLTVSQVNTMLGTLTNPMTTLGDTIYGAASGVTTRLAGNTTTTRKFLAQTGDSVNSAAPSWLALSSADIPNNAANTTGTALNVTGIVATANGGTGVNGSATFPTAGSVQALSPNNHGVVVSGSSTTATVIAPDSSTTKVLKSGGASADPAWADVFSGLSASGANNFLINSNFDFWQEFTSQVIGNLNTNYGPDGWYGKNVLGTNGILTISQVTGVSDGAKFGCSLKITTAPTVAQANGCELYQTLDNLQSLPLYNQTASFSVRIKALGNVNQVGIQFYYKTTEAKVDTAIGSEQLTTVNSSTFTLCTLNGQALGTSQTAAGVIGVRIRITAVSSGNTYDLNNGFVAEQAQVNIGSIAAPWQRAGRTIVDELALCQRYYEVSDTDALTFPGNTTSGSGYWATCPFKVTKRAQPSMSYANENISGYPSGSPTTQSRTVTGVAVSKTANATSNAAIFQYSFIADSRI